MSKAFQFTVILAVLWVAGFLSSGCREGQAVDAPAPVPESSDSYWDKVNQLYEKAKESGEKVPGNVMDWMKGDIGKIGTWEYKVISLELPEPEALELALNALGAERWQVFWMERQEGVWLILCKRPTRSYLRTLPTGDLWKLLPRAE